MQSRPSRMTKMPTRALVLQVIARADAGKAGADDQDVEMFRSVRPGPWSD